MNWLECSINFVFGKKPPKKESHSTADSNFAKFWQTIDKEKIEKDCNVEMEMVKAYCIKEEETAHFKGKSFKTVVPKVMEEKDTDVLVLETGSIEITDINIHEAMMVPEWFQA